MNNVIPLGRPPSGLSEHGSRSARVSTSAGTSSSSPSGSLSMTEVSIDISDPGPDPLPSGSNETEAINLQYIHGNTRLRLILQEWESKLRDSQDIILRKQTLSLNVKNEIYHLIGFFSVFQGVVLTTVSQASLLSCHNWWGPFALSLLASLTTLVGVCHKFWNFISWKRAAEEEIANAKVI